MSVESPLRAPITEEDLGIHNLDGHILHSNPYRVHGLITGSFDPPHLGHASAIQRALVELPDLESIVVLAHDWNKAKNQRPLNDMQRWLHETLGEFVMDPRVRICDDPNVIDDPTHLDGICDLYRYRIWRIIGGDKDPEKLHHRNNVNTILVIPRSSDDISSSKIREAIQAGRIEDIQAQVASTVLNEILAMQCYQR